jgi:hypothetical protein
MLVLGLSPVGEQLCVWIEYNPLFQNRQWDFPDSFCGGQKFFRPCDSAQKLTVSNVENDEMQGLLSVPFVRYAGK